MDPRFLMNTNSDCLADHQDPSSYIRPFFSRNGSANHG
jgi:hypothetical protein